MHDGRWTLRPCRSTRPARAGARGERDHHGVLARRGYADPALAGGFLAGEQPPAADTVAARRHGCCRRADPDGGRGPSGERICVHGDYDVDGICATALAVLTLREAGADVVWRAESGSRRATASRRDAAAGLREEGVGLIVTVDCGITARWRRVAEAKAPGLDVVVTDHHRPGEALPDCPIVATRPSRYPFPELCWHRGSCTSFAQALPRRTAQRSRRHLDLVALATIADVVPLVDENRAARDTSGFGPSPRPRRRAVAGA